MEMDVNLTNSSSETTKPLMTISAGSYKNIGHCYNNTITAATARTNLPLASTSSTSQATAASRRLGGCCGILSRLLCSNRNAGKTASSSSDYNNLSNTNAAVVAINGGCSIRKNQRRTPQEIYFESRGKSCKKLLKFNGTSNKILLYPEEGWARTASSSYWTITPCWWQPNRCRIEEFSGTQHRSTIAKMLPLEQKGSLLIAGHFPNKKVTQNNCNSSSSYSSITNNTNTNTNPNSNRGDWTSATTVVNSNKSSLHDEFKLYLSSNISMEDYNMGYCLTGFVERRCQQTNTFQMTHFAVVKRQWPSIGNNKNETKPT